MPSTTTAHDTADPRPRGATRTVLVAASVRAAAPRPTRIHVQGAAADAAAGEVRGHGRVRRKPLEHRQRLPGPAARPAPTRGRRRPRRRRAPRAATSGRRRGQGRRGCRPGRRHRGWACPPWTARWPAPRGAPRRRRPRRCAAAAAVAAPGRPQRRTPRRPPGTTRAARLHQVARGGLLGGADDAQESQLTPREHGETRHAGAPTRAAGTGGGEPARAAPAPRPPIPPGSRARASSQPLPPGRAPSTAMTCGRPELADRRAVRPQGDSRHRATSSVTPTSTDVARQPRESRPASPAARAASRSSASMPATIVHSDSAAPRRPRRVTAAASPPSRGGDAEQHQGPPGDPQRAPSDRHEDRRGDQQAQRAEASAAPPGRTRPAGDDVGVTGGSGGAAGRCPVTPGRRGRSAGHRHGRSDLLDEAVRAEHRPPQALARGAVEP